MNCCENKHLQMSDVLLGNNSFLEVGVHCCCLFVGVLGGVFCIRNPNGMLVAHRSYFHAQ